MHLIRSNTDIEDWSEGFAFYQIWKGLCHHDALPCWSDFPLPLVLPFLPNLMFVELGRADDEDPSEPYMRFIGSTISSVMPEDATGHRVIDSYNGDEYVGRFRKAIAQGLAYQMKGHPAAFAENDSKRYDAIVVPLSRKDCPADCTGIVTVMRWVRHAG